MPLYIFILIILVQPDNEIAKKLNPMVLKSNLKITGYIISKSFKLNEDEYILIGTDEIQRADNEGHRLIYINKEPNNERFKIKFVSRPKGEAYVYKPYFYEFSNGDKYIVSKKDTNTVLELIYLSSIMAK